MMTRFALLYHELPGGERDSHWDLMLERGESLRTWALEQSPLNVSETAAQQLADHRLAYLTYEGLISGNRGVVSQIDAGEYQLLREETGLLVIRLIGQILRGEVTLRREAEPATAQRWRLVFESD